MDAKPASVLDSFAPHVWVADCGVLLVGTKDRSARTAEGPCNRLLISVAIVLLNRCLRHGCEILEQHAVYEDIPTTNFVKKDASRSIVEKANVIEGGKIIVPKHEAQGKMVKTSTAAKTQPAEQPEKQPEKHPVTQPAEQPAHKHDDQYDYEPTY